MKSGKGYIIVHPNGFLELDYFYSKLDYNKYNSKQPLTPKQWMKRYRPDCILKRGRIVIE